MLDICIDYNINYRKNLLKTFNLIAGAGVNENSRPCILCVFQVLSLYLCGSSVEKLTFTCSPGFILYPPLQL